MKPPASATTTAMALRSGSSALLQLLPDALYCHVLHFLSAEHKLNHLSHLCRHLTPLSTIAFHHSHLELSTATVAKRPRHLLVPASARGVHSLTFNGYGDDAASNAALTQLAAQSPPTAASCFSALRSLSIRLRFSQETSHSSFQSALTPSTAAFPMLERLSLWPTSFELDARKAERWPDFGLFPAALADFPHLHHLTVCLPLHTDEYAAIFTLPFIHTINLCTSPRYSELVMPHAVFVALPSQLSPSCYSLTLPRLDTELPSMLPWAPRKQMSPEPARQMVEQIRQQAAGPCGSGVQCLAGIEITRCCWLPPSLP